MVKMIEILWAGKTAGEFSSLKVIIEKEKIMLYYKIV